MNDIKDIFFDLDHTLWDFDKNSDLTFFKILEINSVKIDVDKFLYAYHPNFSVPKAVVNEFFECAKDCKGPDIVICNLQNNSLD